LVVKEGTSSRYAMLAKAGSKRDRSLHVLVGTLFGSLLVLA
jgi:hypothetical protein